MLIIPPLQARSMPQYSFSVISHPKSQLDFSRITRLDKLIVHNTPCKIYRAQSTCRPRCLFHPQSAQLRRDRRHDTKMLLGRITEVGVDRIAVL